MRNTVLESVALNEKTTEIIEMCHHEANESKVFVIVEGSDDEKIYRLFMDEQKVTFYVAGNCLHVVEILKELKTHQFFNDRLIGIKDADFDHVLHRNYSDIENLFLTDYHDIEMTILSKKFELFLKAEYKIPMDEPLIKKVAGDLKALSYLRLYNEVIVTKKKCEGIELDGINFNDITYTNLYDGENAIKWEHCLSHVKSKCNNARLEHFPTIEVMEEFANNYADIDLKQLTRGHDFIHALQVRLKELCKNEPWGYSGLCLMLRSTYSKEMFERTDLYIHLNIWMEHRGLLLWNKNVA